MREYMARRRRTRREEWQASVGGRCARCGATEGLQADHIDPSTKHPKLKRGGVLWDLPAAELAAELAKCQPLCDPCHREKGAEDIRAGRQRIVIPRKKSSAKPCV